MSGFVTATLQPQGKRTGVGDDWKVDRYPKCSPCLHFVRSFLLGYLMEISLIKKETSSNISLRTVLIDISQEKAHS